MTQKVLQLSDIEYEKKGGELTERTILPVNVPATNILAFDVTGEDESKIEQVRSEYEKFQDYKAAFMKGMFSFDQWLEHIGSDLDPKTLKYRSFDPAKITVK